LRFFIASITYFPPTERGVISPDRRGRRGAPLGEEEWAGWRGLKLEVEDAASGTEEAKAV
jgi:hypothetical protein